MKLPRRFFLDGGMVLMYALSILVILSVIGLSLQTTGASLHELAKESQYRRLAQSAADSGIRYGTAYIRGILDPLYQYTGGDPGAGLISPGAPTLTNGHDYTKGVHPCNIYWRLASTTPGYKVDNWVKGNGASYVTSLAKVPLDPTNPVIDASNPPLYATSFTLSVKAVNMRTSGMLNYASPPYGKLANCGLRWEDLVDQIGAQFCHQCLKAPETPTPPQPPPMGAQAIPVTATCWTPWSTADPASKVSNVTTYCTFRYTQPYVLTCTGTCYINDPLNAGRLKASAVATVVVSQVITVTTRNKGSPGASTHSTFIVTAVNQEW